MFHRFHLEAQKAKMNFSYSQGAIDGKSRKHCMHAIIFLILHFHGWKNKRLTARLDMVKGGRLKCRLCGTVEQCTCVYIVGRGPGSLWLLSTMGEPTPSYTSSTARCKTISKISKHTVAVDICTTYSTPPVHPSALKTSMLTHKTAHVLGGKKFGYTLHVPHLKVGFQHSKKCQTP